MSRAFVPIIRRAIISVITRELRDIVDAFQIDRCRDKGDLSRATLASTRVSRKSENEKAKEKKRKEKKEGNGNIMSGRFLCICIVYKFISQLIFPCDQSLDTASARIENSSFVRFM